ncbi:MerR family transcriptional regulator, partial [Streptomyces sp. NPDC091412]|uniref:MerR family transcriptional regulator n=1 Tax=Streptomyces sp. NPDC091412 TaxID=3366002 RepID=UPI003812EEE4
MLRHVQDRGVLDVTLPEVDHRQLMAVDGDRVGLEQLRPGRVVRDLADEEPLRVHADAGRLRLRVGEDVLGGQRPEAGVRSSGGHRRYAPEALARLRTIRSLRSLGVPVSEIRRVLDSG